MKRAGIRGGSAQRKKRVLMVVGVGFLAVLMLWVLAGHRHHKPSKRVKEILEKPIPDEQKIIEVETLEDEDFDKVEEDQEREDELESEENALEVELSDQDKVLDQMAHTYSKGAKLLDEMKEDKEEIQESLNEAYDEGERKELKQYLGKLDGYIEKVEGLNSEVKSDMDKVYKEESKVEDRIYDIQSEQLEKLEEMGDDLQLLLEDNEEKKEDLKEKVDEESEEEQILQASLLEDLSDATRQEIESKLDTIRRAHDSDLAEMIEAGVEEKDIKDKMSEEYAKELEVDEKMEQAY